MRFQTQVWEMIIILFSLHFSTSLILFTKDNYTHGQFRIPSEQSVNVDNEGEKQSPGTTKVARSYSAWPNVRFHTVNSIQIRWTNCNISTLQLWQQTPCAHSASAFRVQFLALQQGLVHSYIKDGMSRESCIQTYKDKWYCKKQQLTSSSPQSHSSPSSR